MYENERTNMSNYVSLRQAIYMERKSSRLEGELSSKTMFVNHISHEIRTPLNAVKMGLQVLEVEIKNDKHSAECLKTLSEISKASEVVMEIVNDFLLFDKIESGKMQLELEQLEALIFVKESIDPLLVQVSGIMHIASFSGAWVVT